MRSGFRPTLPRSVLALCLTGLSFTASAQSSESSAYPNPNLTGKPRTGERLSDWLLRQPQSATAYPLGLTWNVPAQTEPQSKLKNYLLGELALSPSIGAAQEIRQQLSAWITALPVTGRFPVPSADARWLQAHPDADPLLASDHSVTLPARPATVTVITGKAQRCTVLHVSGAEAFAYLRTCAPDLAQKVDRVWIVQPDGAVQAVNVATWNREKQDEPAPGAWIWAPARDDGWTEHFSSLLAEFMSTQGLAPNATSDQKVPTPALAERSGGVSGVSESTASSRWSQLAMQSEPSRKIMPTLPILAVAGPPLIPTEPSRSLQVSANDWGLIGLLQTPTARMAEPGDLRFHYSHVYPYDRGSVIMQPMDWLEAGFRYTAISNRLYGSSELSGNQSYKDKSLDFKLRLAKETAATPELAIGITDIGGTGLFSSEYFIASKRQGNLDWSIGIGWGNLGSRGSVRNPFTLFGKQFSKRTAPTNDVANAGKFSINEYFHGQSAIFGGLQYQPQNAKWLFKIEYDGNNYQHDPLNNILKQSSPINTSIVYRMSPSVDLTAGVERGNRVMLGFTFHGPLARMNVPKVLDPPFPSVSAAKPQGNPDWTKTVLDLREQTQWTVKEIQRNGSELRVVFVDAFGTFWKDRLNRSAAVLHRDAPEGISRFVLDFVEGNMTMTEEVILRDEWVRKQIQYRAMTEYYESVVAKEPRPQLPAEKLWMSNPKTFTLGWAPSFQQNIGGPDGFLLYQLGIATPARLRINDNTWISGSANFRLIDNYDKFKYDAPSNLPRVRTLLREYLTTSRATLPNLQLTHVGQVSDNQYFSLYGGYLESMFAGVGSEWLYRPWHSPVAFGIDINYVQQRDFKQNFKLRDYRVNTGHATLYWDTGWNATHVNLLAGRYLAGDIGGTLDVNRSFQNGVTIGAYATITNASKAQFGEGRFDKGLYVSIPYDVMMPFSSPTRSTFVWSPLTRDGGARLARGTSLYALTSARGGSSREFAPLGSKNSSASCTDCDDRSLLGDCWNSMTTLGSQIFSSETASALPLAGGLILASSLFDKPLDKWAVKHQGGKWDTMGKAASNIPVALAVSTGLLWWGAGDRMLSETAWTAIKSGALTVGVDTVTRLAVGRARPDQGLGPGHFSGLSRKSGSTGFPSNHMGVAFALVSPFAQQYDAPWLYSIAGATAFGRIQQRQHFVSDVVAGSLIGYGIGSMLIDQQRSQRKTPRLLVGPNHSIQAVWDLD